MNDTELASEVVLKIESHLRDFQVEFNELYLVDVTETPLDIERLAPDALEIFLCLPEDVQVAFKAELDGYAAEDDDVDFVESEDEFVDAVLQFLRSWDEARSVKHNFFMLASALNDTARELSKVERLCPHWLDGGWVK